MKIAHLISRFNAGGTANWIELLSAELEKKGHLVTIILGETEKYEIEKKRCAKIINHI